MTIAEAERPPSLKPPTIAPATYADIRLICGGQGAGKSTIGSGFAVTDYYKNLTGLWLPGGQLIKAKSVDRMANPEDYMTLRRAGIFPNVLKYARIYSDDGKQSKLIKIPADWTAQSPIHIFANYHFYGIRYKRCSLPFVIENINTNLFYDAWILFDESDETSARRSMEAMGKLGAQFAASIRKRRAHYIIMTQFNRMAEVLIRLFASTHIDCTYDEESHYITCEGTRRAERLDFEVYAPDYWPYFDTEEIVETSQEHIDRALAQYWKNAALTG